MHQPGDRIDHYTIREPIGEGGMGAVFHASQTEPVRREVALKVIKPGMDSRDVLARFSAERQALAVMDHSCIARVLDGGTTDRGLPYFVMELVKGEPIDEFCDRHKLTISQRIELFVRVCEGVQHAHMKGVIHRDLKPSNILVEYDGDGHPHPKIIDFGIAKALNQRLSEQTFFTERGQLIGTPEYMSPEQAEMSGLDIDTRSDVYSLGVVLYQLLTGTLPFDPETLRSAGLGEIQRIIREVDPHKPSTRLSSAGDDDTRTKIIQSRATDLRSLESVLKQDLDWIVMRCLEKERTRRYDTPSDIADELHRYLNHEPVEAGPPNVSYRARKFVRRNRVGVIAGSMVAAALLLAVIGTTGGMLWAMSERDRAEAAEEEARTRADELQLVADFQSSQLEGVDVEAMGYGIMEDLVEEIEAALADLPADERASSMESFRSRLRDANFTNLALTALDEHVIELALAAIDEDFADQPAIKAQLLQTVATTLVSLGLLDRALGPQTEALALRRQLLGADHLSTLQSTISMGHLLARHGKYTEAEPYYRVALEGSRRVLGDDHPDTLHSIIRMGELLKQQGRLTEAEPYYREALEGSRRVLGDNDTATAMNHLAILLLAMGRPTEAEPYYREALEDRRRVLGDDHLSTLTSINNLGLLLQDQGKLSEAEPYIHEALEGFRRMLGDDHPSTLTSINNMGYLLHIQGKLDEAEPYFREALAGRRRVHGDEHESTLISVGTHATLLLSQQRHGEAMDVLEASEPIVRRDWTGGNARWMADYISKIGAAKAALGEYAESERILLEAQPILVDGFGEDHQRTVTNTNRLVDLYTAWHEAEPDAGHEVKAAEWKAKLPNEDE